VKKHAEHQDPQRFPKIIDPIEKEMMRIHEVESKKMFIEITKKLVKMKK